MTTEVDTLVPISWEDLVDHCSRLHTTRIRPRTPFSKDMREDSQPLNAFYDGHPIRIVPTRMHEPGFYYWVEDVKDADGFAKAVRSAADLDAFRTAVEGGEVLVPR